MFQSFEVTARPEQGPPRLSALRDELDAEGLDGFLVPRADAHQGEYVAPHDDRLTWLTGFTGSAGFCCVLQAVAGVFIDGRYRTQVKAQVAPVYTPVPWPEVSLADWLKEQLPDGGTIGFDPWLHTPNQITQARDALKGSGVFLQPGTNLVDRIWKDQPPPPMQVAKAHPVEFAGESHAVKRERLAQDLAESGQSAAVITLPDSHNWLLNIRGADIPRNPVAHGFAVLHRDATVDLFMAAAKVEGLADHLGPQVRCHPPETFLEAITALQAPVRLDRQSAPMIVAETLGDKAVWGDDPCALPKACKNDAEIKGTAQAHLRDGAALCETLAWLDMQSPGSITETQLVTHLEAERRKDNALRDISFETIAGTGANGAIIHYRVTEETDSHLQEGDLIVLDSGGQYLDGTTDITRTIAIGRPPKEACAAFTRVLAGMIAMSRLRWPEGLAGAHIEAVGRVPLWQAGQDFDHGLGHGVGAYLSVHEGPQRLSRVSLVPLQAGMILSNEPGYYREGAFGIRLENLLVVRPAPALSEGDAHRKMFVWETLSFVPIDKRLIVAELLDPAALAWLNSYHAEVAEKIGPRVSPETKLWLDAATAPI
ncbi:aminopeptidase P family protein [Sulfitobacter sp. F26204]|uniref:aminopeptidase P family protein n=1 Tax=Sulfitobacter sp. F26204 TaxID=2996014 RepID=UPI00225E6635|nr:aminopeptidase P family protein [Sulfitobacter sp. F26204]MCX7559364.1 aminopeptidase P family protein [Sulfitobacter sp. F26204]